MDNPLIFDIESAPSNVEEYKSIFPKSKKRGGLHAIISEVVAIGIVDGAQPSVISRKQGEIQSEAKLLEWVAKIFREHKNGPLIGFNIKNFDLPLLQLRAAKYGIKLEIPDRRSPRIIDLYEILGGKWATDVSACSLSELGWFLYGQPKQSSGADVAEMWTRGDIESIRLHCMEDVLLTHKIYQGLLGVLW